MKTKIFTIVVLILLFYTCRVQATLNWDIHSDAMIEDGDIYNVVSIYDTHPDHTTVTMVGGLVDVMRPYDTSTLNVTGGNISTLGAMSSSTVNISGQAQIQTVGVNEWSTVNISGGGLASASVSDYATLNMSGGFVDWVIDVADFSTLTVTGGGIGNLLVYDIAVVNLQGGHISSGVISAGAEDFGGVINFYGYGLGMTDLDGCVRVHGFYHDGSPCDINIDEGLSSRVNLIPEPATILLLGLGGFAITHKAASMSV